MKRCILPLVTALPLLLSAQLVEAAVSKEMIEKKLLQEPLMASHVPLTLLKKFHNAETLSYAKGHEFYDTPIVLEDEQGNQINKKHQFSPKKQYKLVTTNKIKRVAENVWFFAPTGINPDAPYSWTACTAEHPCQQFTQDLVDFIHQSTRSANLWAATGTYELPTVRQQQYSPKLLELYDDQHISGRTSNFKQIAYNEKRPLFLGTLSWNDYVEHDGAYGWLSNVIVRVADNLTQVDTQWTNTNVHCTGLLYISNSVLENNSQNKSSTALNVNTENAYIYDSSFKIIAAGPGVNFQTEGWTQITRSSLQADASEAANLGAIGKDGAFLSLIDSTLETKSCPGQYQNSNAILGAIMLYDSYQVSLNSVTMDVQTKTPCDTNENFSAGAILLLNSPGGRYIDLVNSKITVSSESYAVYAINGNLANSGNSPLSINLDNTQIRVSSLHHSAVGIEDSIAPNVHFINSPSSLFVSSPVLAQLFSHESPVISNESTPPSQCVVNEGEPQNC